MKTIIIDEKMHVDFDDAVWNALENYQGNNVTFVRKNNPSNVPVPSLSISRRSMASKNISAVYHYTTVELKRILADFKANVLEKTADFMEFEYSGLYGEMTMKFAQRIKLKDNILSSVTWGTAREYFEECKGIFDELLSGICEEEA